MSLGKLPGIKDLVSSSQGKRRFKSELSVDMISPPLGDFRHTMHVGRGGDVFGDTSFLSNYGGIRDQGSPDSVNSSKATGFFTRTFRHVRKNSGVRPRGDSRDTSSPPPDVSPIVKNTISLPQLNLDVKKREQDEGHHCTDQHVSAFSLHSGFVTLPRVSRLDRQSVDREAQRRSIPDSGGFTLTRSDSLTSFTVDLGPSLMTEVLNLIDKPCCLQMYSHSQAAGEEEGKHEEEQDDNSSLAETPVQSPRETSMGNSTKSQSIEIKLGHTQDYLTRRRMPETLFTRR
uniref:CRIB domain-containing protein n=1 Tax=Mola mola TaxID=94237 RepID=A0A3Q4AH59_MOLML